MRAVELEKAYAPKKFEDRIYAQWKESGAFTPKEGTGDPYVIVIPPPNVTGVLHLGHGLNITLQDIIIRFHRMRGEPVLWVPGTDHAGIATQNVVEKKLKVQGVSRHELGRKKFVEETWKVKSEHHAIISTQLARIGASVDWSRERFTLDEGLSRSVREVFVTLYERNLLYKGHYLVNWCCSCGTALSDDEVEHEKQTGKMYHIRYPRGDGPGFVEIATTRPETLLGDTAVAVHPDDPRYTGLPGRELALPLTGRNIPVIADAYVDREFGTGAVKITPAHDPNDWEIAGRHNLPVINILRPDGRLNDAAPEKYRGCTAAEAREMVLADLKAGGFFVKEEDITHSVGHCYRCNTVIEPFLSEQWFVRMKPLAEKALAAWRNGDIIFYPRKWKNTYQHWLENIRDWCVSRQLWWGHRIPAWYCKKCGKTTVSRMDPASCSHCGSSEIEQDPDVLDTWFSSWLWPFSTLGWPEDASGAAPAASDFERFYPTTALVTGYDIIFFWVSRMIMAGLEFTGKAPFRDIYIHGLIRDKIGRKMSKSLGNGLDPLQMVDKYGADALKFTLAFMCAQGQDILIDEGSFKLGSKFANKVWNAARYILMNLEGRNVVKDPSLLPVDQWIRSRLGTAARAITNALLSYRYNDAAQSAYEYFWNDFCDWYVEATKLSLREGDDAEKDRAVTILLEVLAESLRLLHPFLPFITEEIYGKLPYKGAAAETAGLLINAPYPRYDENRSYPQAEADFAFIQELVTLVRTLRSECTIPPDKKVRVLVRTGGAGRTAFLRENADLVKLLAGMGELETEENPPESARPVPPEERARNKGSIGLVGSGFEALVFVADAVDLILLKQKFLKERAKDTHFITGLQAKLSNENFLKNAPAELVEQEKVKLEEALKRTATLESYIQDLV
ncbi:MAG: valine--tRNA ligase [Spirochaetaceae bacterium]|jgi:valyl-tRNA synthetase|nr:valine--tRNA ligase [Spirochaetaceae bacterium]